MLGKELWEIGLFKDPDQGHAAFQELLAEGDLRFEDLKVKTKTGERREIEASVGVPQVVEAERVDTWMTRHRSRGDAR